VAYRDLIRAFVRFYAEQLFNPRWGESVNLRRDERRKRNTIQMGCSLFIMESAARTGAPTALKD
jgi:hypothetical protein